MCEGNINGYRKRVCLDPPGEEVHEREDGWMEVEMGEFFSEDHEDNLVGFKLWDIARRNDESVSFYGKCFVLICVLEK